MKLQKFKLIDGGIGGIKITCEEYSRTRGDITIPDHVDRTRKVSMPMSFRKSVGRLKYYFLNLTGHWIEPFNKYYDLGTHKIADLPASGPVPMGHQLLITIMNKVSITGVVLTGGGFILTGTINSHGDKEIGIATQIVTEDDDAGFYQEAMGIINNVFHEIGTYFKENMLPIDQPKEYLLTFGDTNQEGFSNLSEKELTDKVLDELQKRGAIIMMSDDNTGPEEDNTGKLTENTEDVKTTLDTRTGNIDGEHLQDVSESLKKANEVNVAITEEKNKQIKKEKKNAKKGIVSENKPEVNDREFPADHISDADIKAAVDPVENEEPAPEVKGTKVKKVAPGSSLVSEKDFAEATGDQVRDDKPVDLTGAEFSEGNHEVDDWSQVAPEDNQAEVSDINFEDSVINP
jgi:hypothetical protein